MLIHVVNTIFYKPLHKSLLFWQSSNINRPMSGTKARAKSAVTRTRKDSSNGLELTINDILHPEHAHLKQETNNV